MKDIDPQASGYLVEQPIVDLIALTLFHPEHRFGYQIIRPGWHDVLFVAVRLHQWRTNEEAQHATRDVLHKLLLWQPRGATSTLNSLHRRGEDSANIRRQYVLLAHEHAPDGGLADALATYLPFELVLHPGYWTDHYLDEAQATRITNTTILLLLAWMVSSKVSR